MHILEKQQHVGATTTNCLKEFCVWRKSKTTGEFSPRLQKRKKKKKERTKKEEIGEPSSLNQILETNSFGKKKLSERIKQNTILLSPILLSFSWKNL